MIKNLSELYISEKLWWRNKFNLSILVLSCLPFVIVWLFGYFGFSIFLSIFVGLFIFAFRFLKLRYEGNHKVLQSILNVIHLDQGVKKSTKRRLEMLDLIAKGIAVKSKTSKNFTFTKSFVKFYSLFQKNQFEPQ